MREHGDLTLAVRSVTSAVADAHRIPDRPRRPGRLMLCDPATVGDAITVPTTQASRRAPPDTRARVSGGSRAAAGPQVQLDRG
jgi:hypothetical protein